MVVVKEKTGTMIRKNTEPNTIQHNCNKQMMMMTVTNSYEFVDSFLLFAVGGRASPYRTAIEHTAMAVVVIIERKE